MTSLTIAGGGIGGLTAAIAAAEQGLGVTVYEAKDRLGNRAWTTDGDFRANWGPHVTYGVGSWWRWLKERGLGEPASRFPRLPKTAFRIDRRGRRLPPVGLIRSLAKIRRRSGPVDRSAVELDSAVHRAQAHRFYFRQRMHVLAFHFAMEVPASHPDGLGRS
jgi:phytoene dehydrogenase-like protein